MSRQEVLVNEALDFEQFGKLIAESSKIMLERRTDKNKIRSIKESASLKQTTKEKPQEGAYLSISHTNNSVL